MAVILSPPSAIAAAPTADPAVNVSGPGAGISRMYGGTVRLGLTPEEVAALAKATGDELVRQCTLISQRASAEASLVQSQAISIGVVEGFLATIKGRKIPQDQWPQVFGELTRQYLQSAAHSSTTIDVSDLTEKAGGPFDEGRARAEPDSVGTASQTSTPSHPPSDAVPALSWEQGRLFIRGASLAAVVDELNRYTSKFIRNRLGTTP